MQCPKCYVHYDDGDKECPICGTHKPFLAAQSKQAVKRPQSTRSIQQSESAHTSAQPARSTSRSRHDQDTFGHTHDKDTYGSAQRASRPAAKSKTAAPKQRSFLWLGIAIFLLLQVLPAIVSFGGSIVDNIRYGDWYSNSGEPSPDHPDPQQPSLPLLDSAWIIVNQADESDSRTITITSIPAEDTDEEYKEEEFEYEIQHSDRIEWGAAYLYYAGQDNMLNHWWEVHFLPAGFEPTHGLPAGDWEDYPEGWGTIHVIQSETGGNPYIYTDGEENYSVPWLIPGQNYDAYPSSASNL